MKEVSIPLPSVFENHGYLQKAAVERREAHLTRFQSYLLLETHDLPDAIAFAFENSTALSQNKAAVSFQRDVDQHDMDFYADAIINKELSKELDSEESESEFFAFMLETANVPEHG